MATRLGLYELLAPEFLVGFTFPEHVDRYLSRLGVDELRVASDSSGVIYTGRCSITGPAGAAPVRQHRDPSGAVFEWDDVTLDFRLTLPRDGAAFIDTTVRTTSVPGAADLNALFDRFGPIEGTPAVPTDYPGVRFRLELLLTALTFHLGSQWLPGTLDAEHRVIPDPARTSNNVRIVLPKVVLVYEQGDDLNVPPTFELASWGSGGFDAPHDLLAGEAIRMEPPLAVHESGRVGLGIGQVVLDLSEDSTPPEILAFFGTDEAFKGVYVRSARVFYADKDKDWAINIAVQDVLISFAGEVSLEASVDIIGPESQMVVSVHLFEGQREVSYIKGTTTGTILPGEGTLLNTGVVHVRITGGSPPYTVSVMLGGIQIWDPSTRSVPISPGAPATLRAPGPATLVVHVEDSGTTGPSGTRKTYDEEIELTITAAAALTTTPDGAPADRPLDRADRPQAEFAVLSRNPDPLPTGYAVSCTPAASGITETIVVTGGHQPTVTVAGQPQTLDSNGAFSLDVPPDSGDITVQVTWPSAAAQRETFRLQFQLSRPDPDIAEASFGPILEAYVADIESPPDQPFSTSHTPSGPPGPPFGAAALRDWIQNRTIADAFIAIDAHASFESETHRTRDQILSERRLAVARAIVRDVRPGVTFHHETAHGHTVAASAPPRRNDPADRVALIEAVTSAPSTGATVQARIRRAPVPTTPPAPTPQPTPTPAPEPNRKPPVFRRAGLRVRLERNVLVLAEISGRLDLETELEAELRQQTSMPSGNLGMKTTPAAVNQNPEDGVVDFLLNVTYDTATHALTERLALGASPDDLSGLLQLTNPNGADGFKNVFGALMVMAPVINSATAALDPASAGDWTAVGISLAVPVTVGGLGVFRTEKVTLFGGELVFRQHVPPGETLTFTDAGVMFDYAVEFDIRIDALNIASTRPLKVRYRAVGFSLHFGGGITYQPIFDTSKGYELDISDPSLLNLPSPLGDILKILSARIARLNPLTLEVDLGLKVDLGVVTIDRFKVKWPLDPIGPPTILPTGVRVDISNVLVGSGYVNIVEPTPGADGVSGGGFDGTADVSLVPLKLRISASLGVRNLQQGDRKAIAIFAGLIVEFPGPIPLGQSGFGIYGLSGLFAMHYKRDELPPDGTAVSPALRWLIRARGEPAKLIVAGDTIWKPELDRWSFGVGAILGTVEGGFVVNMRGMLVLELPGPRILIFVKLQLIADLPELDDAGLDVGMLGVLDLDFNLMQMTIGVIVDLSVGEIIRVTIPAEVFAKLNNPRLWHLYLGTHTAPASALILNLVRANGYFMVDGDRITNWPGTQPPSTLNGLALATGLEASLVFGDVDIGLYLRVAAGAHLGVSFSPKLFVAGRIYLEGELRLFIVSIEASGELSAQVLVESPTDIRTFIDGRICGRVSFFFFSVEGCVQHSIGTPLTALTPPPLVSNVFLQSHAPVLSAGQGGDRPIDASLGDAAPSGVTAVPVVPIDIVPVIQMTASPLVSGVTTFTAPIPASPQQTASGFISLGGDREALYHLREVSLSPALPSGGGLPPATWRTERPPDPTSSDTHIDLALMSRVPTVAERAFERSTDLDASITRRWKGLCTPVAPATCVLYTFCGQPLGPSGSGWRLSGIPQPDPPGTHRSTPQPTLLDVEEPAQNASTALLDLILVDAGRGSVWPAEVIGPNTGDGGGEPPRGELTCLTFDSPVDQPQPNPLRLPGARFGVFNATGAPAPSTEIQMIGAITGLHVGFRTDVVLEAPATIVQVTLAHFAAPARIAAFNAAGAVVDRHSMSAGNATPETLRLAGQGIVRLRIDAPQDETLLLSICFETPRRAEERPGFLVRRFEPRGDEALDRRARAWFERLQERERLLHAEAEEVAIARALTQQVGLARVAATGPATAQARSAAQQDPRRCFRALKFPLHSTTTRTDPIELPEQLEAYAKSRPDDRWIILHTGPATQVVLFLAIARVLVGELRLRQLDASGSIVREDALTSLSPTNVTGVTTGLPTHWIDPAGPWLAHVQPVATFLADPAFRDLMRLVVTLKPEERIDRLQVLVPNSAPVVPPPGMLLGVVEVCPRAEAERQATDEIVQQGQIETVTGYLNGGSTVPLLVPNTIYTLKVRYDVSTRLSGGSPSGAGSPIQEFRFKTDANPPARLDPYVLGTTPDGEDRFHFYEDPVKLVFNDLAVLQLYAAYGRQLRFALHAADGLPMATHTVSSLDRVTAESLTPYRDFLEDMIAAGQLPCVGAAIAEQHGSWTAPVTLRPLMDYTLDIELDPPLPAPPANEPRMPFFRRSFSTSRFPSLAALAADVRRKLIRHRPLTTQIGGLPTMTPVAMATDEVIQAALVAAGEQALPGPATAGVVVYWVRRAGTTTYSPHAILIDAAEPLWRMRSEPKLETVPGQLDPAYKRIVPGQAESLRLVELTSNAVARFVRSPGGTRTLAVLSDSFNPPPTGQTITIVAQRPASSLYGLSVLNQVLLEIPLTPTAPWESDDA